MTRTIRSEKEKRTENEGDNTSLPRAKRHQRAMGAVQERAIETAFLLSYVHWVRPYGSAMSSELRVSPYGRRGRVRHNCRAHSDLRRRWPSSDLDAGEAALRNGRSDGHRVPAESDQGKEAGSRTLDRLLHVLAEMAHLRLRLAAGEIAGARSCVRCCVSHANGGGIMGSHHNERVGSGCKRRRLSNLLPLIDGCDRIGMTYRDLRQRRGEKWL